ncbi:hypothetical protein ACQ4PT_010103 [Festuca glaucescens]
MENHPQGPLSPSHLNLCSPKPWDGRGMGEAATPTAADVQVGLKGLTRMLTREVHNLTELRHLEVFSKKLTGKLPSLAGLTSLHVILAIKKIFTSIADGFFKGLTALTVVNLDENPLEPWTIPTDLVDRESLLNFSINSVNLTCALPEFIGAPELLFFSPSLPSLADVGETSSVRKRKFDEVDDSEDSSHSYVSSDIESGDAVSYNSASSDASSEAEVTKYNELSYEKRVEEKIWEEGVSAYLNTARKYYCKFHHFKQVPRDGMREGLVAHAKTVKPKDRRDKANHAALIKVLEYYGRD